MPLMFKALPVDRTTLGGQNTYVIDLAGAGDMHTLFLKVEATNVAAPTANRSILYPISSLQIAGPGATPYVAISPLHLIKVHYFRMGSLPEWKFDCRGNAVQSIILPVYFGRDLVDTNVFLPTARFKELKAYLVVPDETAGGMFVSGSFRVSAWALTSIEASPGPYAGTLLLKEIGTKATTGSGEIVFSVPREKRIARIYTTVEHPTANLADVLGAIKLDVDRGRVRYSDVSAGSVQAVYRAQFPFERVFSLVVLAANGANVDTLLGNYAFAMAQNLQPEDPTGDTVYTAKVTGISGPQVTLGAWSGDWTGTAFDVIADTTARPILLTVHLAGLPNVAVFDFVPLGWDTLFYHPGAERIDLILEDKLSGGSVTAITETLEPVP